VNESVQIGVLLGGATLILGLTGILLSIHFRGMDKIGKAFDALQLEFRRDLAKLDDKGEQRVNTLDHKLQGEISRTALERRQEILIVQKIADQHNETAIETTRIATRTEARVDALEQAIKVLLRRGRE